METYLATFHEEYVATVEGYVPEEARSRLTRYSLLPAVQVTGYVSTQLGAGYEYREGDGGISIIRGVAASVSFKAGTWSRDVLFAHLFATRQEGFWSEAHAVRRAKDEVLPALLDLQQSAARSLDLGTYLRTFEKRTILVLGDFKHGRDRLEAIRGALQATGYEALLLDEVPDDLNYDLPQKFHAVASVCRFPVFEDSTPSGHIAEMFSAEPSHPIRIVLREGEKQSTFMTRAMGLTSRVRREWSYDETNLDAVLGEAVEWAQLLVAELAEQHVATYP